MSTKTMRTSHLGGMTVKPETKGAKATKAKRKAPKKKVASFVNSPTFDKIYGQPQKPPKKTNLKRVFVKE